VIAIVFAGVVDAPSHLPSRLLLLPLLLNLQFEFAVAFDLPSPLLPLLSFYP
jgi:hypothetical protein